jgi:CheY-specific phosphatase CheX
MSDVDVDPECLEKMRDLVRNVSIDRFRRASQEESFKLLETTGGKKNIYDHWMALILVSGKALRITFKVHFNIKSTKKMASPIYGKSPEKIEIRQAKDFIKEFCNLAAGYIKKIFEDQSLDVGISLPLVIRGFDEVFFERQIKKTIIEDSFRIENSGIGVVCTNIVEIFNQNLLDGIDINVEEEEEEIDFL